MKGVELPINALVIIVIAVLVLLGIVALWLSGWGGSAQGVSVEAAKAAGCRLVIGYTGGCTAATPSSIVYDGANTALHLFSFDADGNGQAGQAADTLQALCDRYYGTATSAPACRKICGCSG